jgi:hypothetical protein
VLENQDRLSSLEEDLNSSHLYPAECRYLSCLSLLGLLRSLGVVPPFGQQGGSVRPTLILGLSLVVVPGLAQAEPRATLAVPCSVRIRAIASADYDPSSEFTLQGTVIALGDGHLKLKVSCGVVTVQTGSAFPGQAISLGQTLAVIACTMQKEGSQRIVARELRHAGGSHALRDVRGVPLP